MKIKLITSAISSISAWLHGEGGKDFRTYTYPRIKQATRRLINLGLYERIEHLYRIVDDTFYKGAIDIEPQDPLELERMERMVEEVEDRGIEIDAGALPRFSTIKDKLFIWKGLEQGRTYRCGTFTVNNMLRTQMLKRGLKPELEVTAIDPLYIATKHGKGKTGTVMDNAFDYLASKGFMSPSWSPRMTDHNSELAALESSLVIMNAEMFPSIKTTGQVKKARTFMEAVALDNTLPSNWEMQVSISFNASLKYFGQLVPYLAKVNGRYSLTRTGGHSVHGVRGSFSTWEDGEEGMAIIESAYRSSEDGMRFLKAKLFTYGMITVRFVEFSTDGNTVTPDPVTPPTTDILETARITFGDKGAAVVALQNYLIAGGFSIPAGATGNFGPQTQAALKQWQDRYFGPLYDGTVWGSISQKKYIELK